MDPTSRLTLTSPVIVYHIIVQVQTGLLYVKRLVTTFL